MANGVYLVRLCRLLQGLLALEPDDTTTVWRSLLRKYPLEEWVKAIDLHTPDGFKTLLSSDLPPTLDQLQRLRWIAATPESKIALVRRTDGTGDEHIYIGSATSPRRSQVTLQI